MNDKKPLVILTGPTAVGKTELSIKLAKAINGAIISADSMQIYKHMDIGTAKITKQEMAGIAHFLVDELEPSEEFNVVIFQQKAKQAIDEIYSLGKIPIIVGGTGFYIQSVLYDIDFTENNNDIEYRQYLEQLAKEKGSGYIHEMLKQVDEISARDIHANNVKKVIRALEYYKQTGKPISKHNEEQSQNESPYNFIYFVLNNDRELLYQRIDKRVDDMVEKGLFDEVKKLKDIGYDKSYVSMQGIGYKEVFDYLNSDISYEDSIYILKRNTRHFAKRQLTWFKREKNVTWMNYQDYNNSCDNILDAMLDKLYKKNIITERI